MTDTTTTDPAPVKPGYLTTEFWLSIAATALTALFASGALTGNTALAIAGMAATVLTALGYKVSRTLVKTGAALLLVGLLAGPQLACATLKADETAVKVATVDCVKGDRTAIEALLGELAWDGFESAAKLGAPDWNALLSAAEARGVAVGGCAFAELVAARRPAAPVSTGTAVSALATPPPAPDPARAALERLRANFGGVRWRTATGEL